MAGQTSPRALRGTPRTLALLSLPLGAAALAWTAFAGTGVRAQARPQTPVPNASACTALLGRTIGGAKIDGADAVAAGTSLGSDLSGPIVAPATMCRVRGAASSGSDSSIRLEVWLPVEWNGKLLGTGGGGMNGGIGGTANELAEAVGRGYAGMANDLGHEMSGSAKWALGHPQKVADFGHLGDHLAAVAAKAIVGAYYRKSPARSYFRGCSGGGREALILAQRYPADYDGIIAGAPAGDFSGLMSTAMWNAQRFRRIPEAVEFPKKLSLLREGAVRKCDKLDGVADGVIANPLSCRFDPAELQCKAGADPKTCLSTAEVGIAREIYGGPRLANGTRIVPGYPVGSEFDPVSRGWEPFITENGIGAIVLGGEYFRYLVYQDPKWSPKSFDLDRAYADARMKAGSAIDAINPDLSAFIKRGGKLLIYHGWEDPVIPAGRTLEYYEAVRRRLGPASGNSVRLLMLPGVGHCAGGHGPSIFDKLDTLDRWVGSGKAPDRVSISKYDNDAAALAGKPAKLLQTRLACTWPQVARYKGKGSPDDIANYACVPTGKRQ